MFILIFTFAVVIVTLVYGLIKFFKGEINDNKKLKKVLKINMAAFVPLLCAAVIILIPDIAHAAVNGTVSGDSGLGYIAAALSTGISAIGAGYAVAVTGSAALGAISEDSKLLGKTIIYVGLAEGIAIYGLIVSLIILSKI